MANNTSQHILNTSANLLGFCLFVITSFHITNQSKSSKIDEFAIGVAIGLVISCFFSFFSMKTQNPSREIWLEKIAEYFFALSLAGIFIVILFIGLQIIE